MPISQTPKEIIAGLYAAVFNRAPDKEGLDFWAAQAGAGDATEVYQDIMDPAGSATGFVDHPVFKSAYDNLTNAEFAAKIYENALGQAGDQEGINFWTKELDLGMSRGDMVVDFVQGALTGDFTTENFPNLTADELAAARERQDYLQNKVNVAIHWIDELGDKTNVTDANNPENDPAYIASISVLKEVNQDPATVDHMNAIIDEASPTADSPQFIIDHVDGHSTSAGEVNLTSATDNVSGSVFNAGLVFNPGGTDRVNSLQDEDELTGTDGADVLNATLGNANDNGGTVITPKMNGIETINVEFTGSGTGLQGNSAVTDLDVQDATGLTEVNVDRVTSAANVARVENIQSVLNTMSVSNTHANENGVVEFSFGTNTLAGDNTAALNLDSVELFALNVGQNTSGTGASGVSGQGYETLNLDSAGNANNIGNLNIPMDTGTSGKLNITGSADLTLATSTNVGSIAPVSIPSNVEATIYGGGVNLAGGRIDAIDASAFTGDLTVALSNVFSVGKAGTSGTPQDVTVTGGSGDDTFILQEAIQTGDILNGGEGNDTAVFMGGSSIASKAVSIENARFEADGNPVTATATADFDNLPDVTSVAVRNISNDGAEGTEGNAVFNLNDLTQVQADAISVEHATTGATSITDTTINADLKNASGAADSVTTIIADNVNTDPRFNYTLNVDGDNGDGDAVNNDGRVENITIDDRDSESNSIELSNFADRAEGTETATTGEVSGTITLKGGAAGNFINLDVDTAIADAAADAGATTGLYQYDISGGTGDGDGYLDVLDSATQVRIITENIDATAHAGNTVVRVGNTTGAIQNQTINLGAGNDTVIFDSLQDSTAGLTIADTVSGGEGYDKLALDGHNAPLDPSGIRAIDLGASEWTHVSGIDEIVLVGNGVNTRGTSPGSVTNDKGGYNLVLTNDLIDSTDNGSTLVITNDSGERQTATSYESTVTIDARSLNTANNFTYNGEENSTAGSISSGATSDVFMFNDVTLNGTHVIDGGDENVQALNQNSDVVEVWNTAVVTQGDLANITNVGGISFRSDSAAPQTLTLRLTDAILDNFDTSQISTLANPETISLSAIAEAAGIGQKTINLDLSEVTQGLYLFDTTGIADTEFNATTANSPVELNVTSNGSQAEGLAKLNNIGGTTPPPTAGTATVTVNAAGIDDAAAGANNTHDAGIADTTFNITSGLTADYTYTIDNFAQGDVIDFDAGFLAPSIVQSSFTDNIIDITASDASGNTATIHLIGLTVEDGALFIVDQAGFNNTFTGGLI